MVDHDDTDAGGPFVRVLESLLRPLVRAMISQGVTAPALYRLLKRLFVEVAEQDFALDGGRQTDSRISLLTGVHRRDVRAFRGADITARTAARERASTLASVLGRWLADPATRDDSGAPRSLPRGATSGPSFEELVRSVSTDIRPRTVLDELERQGLVRTTESEVHLKADAFVGPGDLDQKAHFFQDNVGDHIAAAVDNLLAEEPRFMERAVFYNRLSAASVDALEAEAQQLATAALLQLNTLGHDRQLRDVASGEGTQRFRFGVFFYREDEGSTQPPSQAGDEA